MKKFAFIVHLRGIEDIAHTIPLVPEWVITKILKRPILWLMWRLHGRMGFMVRSTFKVDDVAQGHILVIWLTGHQMITPNSNGSVKKRILEAILHAQNELGCSVVGLGALTASVTSAGRWVASHPEIKCAITHGDHHATGLAIEGIERLATENFGSSLSNLTLNLIGATGIIGDALTRALIPLTGKLIITGRKKSKLAQYANLPNVVISDNINDAISADIVVTATSWPDALIKPEHLKEGALVYEVSQPRNVSRQVAEKRKDVLVIDGSYAKVPENINFWWMSLPHHHTFGCMAETIMQCLENDPGHHVGSIDLSFMEEVRRRAQKYGFSHADFTSFNTPISISSKDF
jgi:fatty aldehyde-generating acyl-ACP reductase